MQKEYRKSGELSSCKLTKTDLVELFEYINGVYLNEEPSYDISSSFEHVEFRGDNFKTFLNIKGLPNVLDNLEIRCYAEKKYLTLFFSHFRNYLSVSGLDETWVLGTYQKIENFLRQKRSFYHYFYRRIGLVYFTLGSLTVILPIMMLIQFIKKDYLNTIILFFFILLIFYFQKISKKILPFFVLELIKPDTFFTRHTLIIIGLIFTIFGVIFQLISLIISLR
jgi:hypothetical protein